MSSSKSEVFKILILGGYGNAGRPLVKLLLQHYESPKQLRLILAGRHLERANEFIQELNLEFPSSKDRLAARQVDAADPSSLRAAFRDINMVVVVSSTVAFTENVAKAALEAGIDYYDILFSTEKNEVLGEMAPEIKKAGLCFITEGGFHPGLPAALIDYVGDSFQSLDSAQVSSFINQDFNSFKDLSPETMEEFAGEIVNMKGLVYEGGAWKDPGVMAVKEVDFGEPFGKQNCVPMYLEEMKAIPETHPDISETGFYIGGFNWVVNFLITPVIFLALKLFPQRAKRAMGRFMYWGLCKFSKSPFGTILLVEAKGIGRDGAPLEKKVSVSHEDGYLFTAIPVVATLLQYLSEKESIRKPGLWFQANLVNAEQLMVDMDKMGITITPPLH